MPLAAVSGAALATKGFLDRAGKHRKESAECDAAELERRNDALMDVYGDRSSLEALERAVQFYENKGR